MVELEEIQRIRYPPFEASRWIPAALPIAQRRITLGSFDSAEDAQSFLNVKGPSVHIGDEDSWLIQRSYRYGTDEMFPIGEAPFLEHEVYPNVVYRQRQGWYLIPNPIHNILRKFINAVVVVLLLSLTYLFLSPVLIFLSVPVYGIETVRWGLLDYPSLAVFVIPLIFAPLVTRVVANLLDLRRQNAFLKRGLTSPQIEFIKPSISDQPLEINLNFPEWDKGWKHVDVMWRVGILPPAREALLELLGREERQQPPPGLATELPHHWEEGLDDGTAGGEDAPMELHNVKGGFYLRPMRIMQTGGSQRWVDGEPINLAPPEPVWPGSLNSDLIRIHWECIIRIDRQQEGALLWVQPLKVAHSTAGMKIIDLPMHDGRSELDIK
ncbi:MAG: hypothetical protein ISR20_00230 [Candidatus Poseidonia sp.]|nr:hypothetical protein [Poseidonia sp.]